MGCMAIEARSKVVMRSAPGNFWVVCASDLEGSGDDIRDNDRYLNPDCLNFIPALGRGFAK